MRARSYAPRCPTLEFSSDPIAKAKARAKAFAQISQWLLGKTHRFGIRVCFACRAVPFYYTLAVGIIILS